MDCVLDLFTVRDFRKPAITYTTVNVLLETLNWILGPLIGAGCQHTCFPRVTVPLYYLKPGHYGHL